MAIGDDVLTIDALGVLDEFDYQLSFREAAERIRIVYAPNGRGKTNFIKAVNFLLTPSIESLQALIEIPIRNLHITFKSGGAIWLQRASAFDGGFTIGASRTADAEDISLEVDPSDFAGRLYRRVWSDRQDFGRFVELTTSMTNGAVLIGDDRLAPIGGEELREGTRIDARRRNAGSVSRLLERVERMLSQSAFAGLARERANIGVYAQITRTTLAGTQTLTSGAARNALETQIATLLRAGSAHERYGLLSTRQLHEIQAQLDAARQNHRQLPTLHRILKPFLDSVQAQIDSLAPALQLIDTFVSGVNRFLDRKELVFSAATGISLVGRDGATLQPDALSSGERHLLYLMSHAILATADRPLVIIDEPELSLGIEWQRNLIDELLQCTEAASVQFLIASHSLQVMNAVPREEIIQPGESE
ncbi:ATP-binding protein [Curtobacterium sp. TC1]|uniref:AAA family ATPase n=1 Tax=Curtobacterium sp. TC1 TaxID=2862880 RepID=UPI001C9AD32D|nr:AAA family ATPase [Curtobacterium sp. TC1]QZQ55576.1 ATP-binding protein [Curtobacterium sp. TC1]